jgi:hypothetical protein
MKSEVSNAVSNMQKRFELLAGESLKKPALELLHENSPLENSVVVVSVQNTSPMQVPVDTLFIKNTGDKKTEPLSIRVSAAVPVGLGFSSSQEWEAVSSSEKDFPWTFYSIRHATVAPLETLNIHPLILSLEYSMLWSSPNHQTNVPCKIQVFYGGEKPAEARFQIRAQLKQ